MDNKKIEEIVERNKDITSAFLISIMNVEMNTHACKTFSEMAEFERENNNNLALAGMLKNDSVQVLSELKVFRQYGDISINSINKILLHEHRDDLLIKKDEMIDKWLERIKNKKEGSLWVAIYANMFSLVKEINDGRVQKIRDELHIKGEIK